MASSKLASTFLAALACLAGAGAADAQFTNRSTSGQLTGTVTIFGDEPVSDSRSGGGDGPWTISLGLQVQGMNGEGNAGGTITSDISSTGLIATGEYSVYAAGFAGGTSAAAGIEYSASFTITQPTPYTLSLTGFDFVQLIGPGFNIMDFGVSINQSGTLQPGNYSFGYSGSGSGFGGQGTGGGFNIRWVIPAPGSAALGFAAIILGARRRR